MTLILPNTIANATPADGEKLDQNFDAVADYVNQNLISADGSTAMTAPLLLPGKPTQPNQAATKQYVDDLIPVAVMQMYGGDTAPTNWMLCRGQAISRATYAALFAAVGTRFGTGDGSTTFNLPDMKGVFPFGFNAGGTYGQVAVGQKFGNKDQVVIDHAHGIIDHAHHAGGLNTGFDDTNHYHAPQAPYSSFVGYVGSGGSNALAAGATVGFMPTTDWRNAQHKHAILGDTAAASTWTINTTGAVSPTNQNLPPALALNFIIKVQ